LKLPEEKKEKNQQTLDASFDVLKYEMLLETIALDRE